MRRRRLIKKRKFISSEGNKLTNLYICKSAKLGVTNRIRGMVHERKHEKLVGTKTSTIIMNCFYVKIKALERKTTKLRWFE